MAFKMNRPTIKGTPLHKASVAKAKAKSIVSQARATADLGLVAAAEMLGKSYRPSQVNYGLDQKQIKFSDKTKEKTPKVNKDYKEYKKEMQDLEGGDKGILSQKEYEKLNKDNKSSRQKNRKFNEEQNKREDETAVSLDTTSVRPMPTRQALNDLQTTTATVDTNKSSDRFIKAAEKFGIEINTPEDYEAAENKMQYNDEVDKWELKPTPTEISKLSSNVESEPPSDSLMESIESKKTDDIRVQTPKQEKIEVELPTVADDKRRAELLAEADAKQKSKDDIAEAKEYWNKKTLKQSDLDEYIKRKNEGTLDSDKMLGNNDDLSEEDSPDYYSIPENEMLRLNFDPENPSELSTQTFAADDEEVINEEIVEEPIVEPEKKLIGPKPKNINASRPPLRKKAAKQITSEQARDNRIYNNAIKGGKLQQNMIKSGYVPQ